GVKGCKRFLERVWALQDMLVDEPMRRDVESAIHNCLKKVSEDIEALKFNTAIAAMMSLVNTMYDKGSVTRY
ncbi:MAG: hypothetical protein IJC25_07545, partial [Clostridia bacterium]|nr:hypothetical protein [Clostridia bacterium]